MPACCLLVPPTGRAQDAPNRPLRIIAFGAHPDDCELKASGVAAHWTQRGDRVKFVAMTNGDVLHFAQARYRTDVPQGEAERKAFIMNLVQQRDAGVADRYRDRLVALYGEARGRAIRYAEAFELSEYGRQSTLDELKHLFPTFD